MKKTNKTIDDYKREIEIAKHIYQLDTKILDNGFGLALYIVDLEATKNSTRHFFGSWDKAKDENGVIEKYYLKVCPRWSKDIEAAFELLKICLEPAIPSLPRYTDFIDIVLLRQI